MGMKDRYGFDFRRSSTLLSRECRDRASDAVFSVSKLSLDQQSPGISMAQARWQIQHPSLLLLREEATDCARIERIPPSGDADIGKIPRAYMAHPWRLSDEILWMAF